MNLFFHAHADRPGQAHNGPDTAGHYDTAPLWVAMLYPNRPREYHSLLTLMHFESKTYQEGIGPSDIILSELNRIGKSSGQGHVAGVVAV